MQGARAVECDRGTLSARRLKGEERVEGGVWVGGWVDGKQRRERAAVPGSSRCGSSSSSSIVVGRHSSKKGGEREAMPSRTGAAEREIDR